MRILAVARKRESWTCGIQSDCHVGGRVDLSILRRCYGHTAAYHLKRGFAFVFSTASTDSLRVRGGKSGRWRVTAAAAGDASPPDRDSSRVAMLAKGRGGFAVVYSRKLVAKSTYGDL